jgi:hypothetical protein
MPGRGAKDGERAARGATTRYHGWNGQDGRILKMLTAALVGAFVLCELAVVIASGAVLVVRPPWIKTHDVVYSTFVTMFFTLPILGICLVRKHWLYPGVGLLTFAVGCFVFFVPR